METFNFIEEYKLAVSQTDCEFIINWFDDNTHLQFSGQCGEELNHSKKISTDISMNFFTDNTDVSKIIFNKLCEVLEVYKNKYPYLNSIAPWELDSNYNLQKYKPGEGFYMLHSEQGPFEYSKRMLVWTLYLNTVTDAGGTWYEYQNQTVNSEQGKICFFPAAWTHMHKGIVSESQTKYIATGWFNFV